MNRRSPDNLPLERDRKHEGVVLLTTWRGAWASTAIRDLKDDPSNCPQEQIGWMWIGMTWTWLQGTFRCGVTWGQRHCRDFFSWTVRIVQFVCFSVWFSVFHSQVICWTMGLVMFGFIYSIIKFLPPSQVSYILGSTPTCPDNCFAKHVRHTVFETLNSSIKPNNQSLA